MKIEAFWPALERCGHEAAAADWKLLAGKDWRNGPLRKSVRIAETILDPQNTEHHLDVIDGKSSPCAVDLDFHPRRDVSLLAEDIVVWEVDFDRLAAMLGKALGFISKTQTNVDGRNCVQVGNVIIRKSPAIAVYLLLTKGGSIDVVEAVSCIAALPSSVLYLPSSRWGTEEVFTVAKAQGVQIDFVAERLKAAEPGSTHVRTLSSKKKKAAILDVQPDWMWEKLKVTLSVLGKISVRYGRHTASYNFRKVLKKSTRHTELLLSMILTEKWVGKPSGDKSHESDRKAFQRLRKELKELLPISGDPFEKRSGVWYPVFKLLLENSEKERISERRRRHEEDLID